MKSFVAKDGSSEPPSSGRNGERDFHGEKRSNETHVSTTEPEAKRYRKGKGKEAKLYYIGNVMTENRNGFVVEAELRQVSGTVEREAATAMIVRHSPGAQRICAISIACNMCASATGTTIGWSAPTPRSRSPICSATPTSRCRHALNKSPHRNSRRPRNPPENAADVPGVVPRRREFR